MSKELLGSKIIVTEEQPRIRQIQGVPTGVFGMVGITEMGPVGERVRSTSFDEWLETFGAAIADGDAYHAVAGFFDNGGQVLDFVRTVHYTNPDTPSTKQSDKADLTIQTSGGGVTQGTVLGTVSEPFDLVNGDTLDIETDAGGPTTATFNAVSATVTGANTETFALADGQTLTFEVDGEAKSVTFDTAEFVDIANALAAEVAAVINAEATGISADVVAGAVRITSDSQGSDSSIGTFGGTANATLGFTGLSDTGAGGSNVADIDAVTVAEVKTIVEAAVAGVTVTDEGGYVRITRDVAGAAAWVRVNATSSADDELGLDNAQHYGNSGAAVDTLTIEAKWDGTYAHDITIIIARATSQEAEKFNLKVLDNGIVKEVWPNLTMDSTSPDYVVTKMNNVDTGSKLVQAVDEGAAGTATERRPTGGDTAPDYTATTHGPLTGGDDGLVGLVDADFIGSPASTKTGFYVLNSSLDLAIIACPDRPTDAVHNFMITYAEDVRDGQCFVILDPPAGYDRDEIVTYVETTASLLNLTEFAAIYWPQVKVLNPNATVFGDDESIVVPPSGHIAGVYVRTDASQPGGVHKPPAGVVRGVLRGVVGFEDETVMEPDVRDIVFPKMINPLTTEPGLPLYIDGSRCLNPQGNFPHVAERRGVIYIEQSIKRGLHFARHADNTPTLRKEVDRTIGAFLLLQYNQEAFRGTTPNNSFFVDVGDALNPPSEQFAKKLNARIGLATKKPAEYIVLRFSQDTRDYEAELAAAGL